MSQPLYKIEEETTSGWSLYNDDCKSLTKEQCKEKYDGLVQSGENPNRLRVVRVS